jgi:transposase
MDKFETNAIKMSPDERYFLRKYIIRLHLKGKDTTEIADLTGAKKRHIQSTVQKYIKGGKEAIALKRMGRPVGKNSVITREEEEKVKSAIIKSTPKAFKLNGFLWNMKNIIALVMILTGIQVKRSTLAVYLRRWGFSPQRPAIYNKKQRPEEVKRWLEEEYPEIKRRAKEEDCEIYWGDETRVQNRCNYQVGYAPKGETPIARLNQERKIKVNLISAINNQGKLSFMMYDERMNQQRLIVFLGRLIKSSIKKVFVILDNLSVHHGKILKEWLKHNADRIEIFHLPSYSPELNPDEHFNGTLKRTLEAEGNIDSKEKLDIAVHNSAKIIQSDKNLIVRLFEAKTVKYAA